LTELSSQWDGVFLRHSVHRYVTELIPLTVSNWCRQVAHGKGSVGVRP